LLSRPDSTLYSTLCYCSIKEQFCGINVIAYYSSTIFRQAGFDEINALGATLGFGALNWVA